MRSFVCCLPFLLASGVTAADDASKEVPAAKEEAVVPKKEVKEKKEKGESAQSRETKVAKAADAGGAKTMSGMSILGNQEAPKSLVIVPWKSSNIGDMTTFSRVLDDS